MKLFTPLTLPNGTTIPNRLAKAAMEENMADADHAPSDALLRLYDAWARGGAGLILTGNVMIDAQAMTGPNGVVLQDDAHLERFRRWADTARAQGAQIWMQLNHPGRQMQSALGQPTVAPSAVALDLGSLSKRFAVPRELTPADIADVQARFVRSAELAEQAGFNGVQIHAAHGYLLSQFLSPLTNKRQDAWGGSLENRARLLIDVVRAVRQVVSPGFAVAVKLNSADFQRGGFSADDAKRVVELLNPLGVDLVELSGGSYEAPAMQGQARDGRTLAREAYFLEFARDITAVARMPLMVTGGRAASHRGRAGDRFRRGDGRHCHGLVHRPRAAPSLAGWQTQRAESAPDHVEEQDTRLAGQHGRRQVPAQPAERRAHDETRRLATQGIDLAADRNGMSDAALSPVDGTKRRAVTRYLAGSSKAGSMGTR